MKSKKSLTSKSGLKARNLVAILAELISFAVNAISRLKILVQSQKQNIAKKEVNNRVCLARFQFYQKNYEKHDTFVNYI